MNLSIEDRVDHLLVRGRQFLSTSEAEGHFVELSAALEDVRRSGRSVRVLVDLRSCPPQAPEVAEIIRARTSLLYRPFERVAILAKSAILKLQLKRIHAGQGFGVFLAEEHARAFLFDDQDGHAAPPRPPLPGHRSLPCPTN